MTTFSNLLTLLPLIGIVINGLLHAEQYVNTRASFFDSSVYCLLNVMQYQ